MQDAVYDFNELCAPWYDELVTYVTKRTGSRHKAEDVVQDSMVRALRAWDRWVPQGDPVVWARAWMYRIVSNTFKLNYTRDKHLQRIVGNGHGDWREQNRDLDQPWFKPNGQTPTQLQVAGELYQELDCVHPYMAPDTLGDEVREALDRIKPEFAVVVRMVYIEGTSETLVAKELGLAPGTVRSRMARGRMALARILGPLARQRFGFGPQSLAAGGADEAHGALEPVEFLEADADGVDAVMTYDDATLLDLAEPGPDAYAAD